MTRSWLLVGVLGCGLGCRPGAQRCGELRDHVIDVRLDGVPDPAAHRGAFAQAIGDDFVARCKDTITERELDCMLAAHDADAIAACGRR